MKPAKEIISRVLPGLKIIEPGILKGILVGSAAALLLPTVISIGSLATNTLAGLPQTKLGRSVAPWANALVAPENWILILIVLLLALGFIARRSLSRFSIRLYTWSVYEGTIVWIVTSFVVFTVHSAWLRVCLLLVAVLVSLRIGWVRTPLLTSAEPLFSADRPIRRNSEDKLDRKSLVVSLVNRLVSDAAPVIALIEAYGDGKTSILNLLREELEKQQIVVVSFKSALPGDDLTLISTLFNSIGQQLQHRFFIRPLGIVLRKFVRRFVGVLPSAPSGVKEIFSAPSQEDELKELTTRLETLPVRRIVVLLDDMDRMQGNELRALLKVIRAADEYPKLSFVCAFNKKALVDAMIRHQISDRVAMSFTPNGGTAFSGMLIGEVTADDTREGYEYLEKFFPVQVPVPKLDDSQAAKEFDLRFNRFAQNNGLSMLPEDTAAFDKVFQPYWKSHFLPSLNNLRKFTTYFNALNSSFNLVRNEVNVIDFMCIELLRQTEPEVYEQVFRNRSLFYYPEWDVFRWDERAVDLNEERKKKRLSDAFDQIFRNLHGQDREFTVSLLGHLFPKVAAYNDARGLSSTGTPSELEADKNKRIYHPDHFTTYFSLHVQEGYFSTQEIEDLLAGVAQSRSESANAAYFAKYIRSLSGVKKYRFFEKMMRSEERVLPATARAIAIAVAAESHTLQHDDFNMGEFGTATRLVLALANRLGDDAGITQLLKDVIANCTSDALAQRVLHFATDKENNKIFAKWDFVNFDELKASFSARMNARYFVGGNNSIYAPLSTWREWQALFSWARTSNEASQDVKNYLEDEFERRPASIGKHVLWLWASVNNQNGRKIVDDLFPLRRLAELARKHGPAAYSTEAETSVVSSLIGLYGKPEPPKVEADKQEPDMENAPSA